MNKIESIGYLEEKGIPTLSIHIIERDRIREQVTKVFHPNAIGWVARSGSRPSPLRDGTSDGKMPWHATKPLDQYANPRDQLEELISAVEDIYQRLSSNQVAFLHHQRQFQKSGVIRIDDVTAVVEAVPGWPEGLSHGKVNPTVIYFFHLPSLFTHPTGFEGDGTFLTPLEISLIGSRIANRLNFAEILGQMDDTLAVEFSFGNYQWGYDISAHDIMVGKVRDKQPYAIRADIGGKHSIHLPSGGLTELAGISFSVLMSGLNIPSEKILAIPEELRQMTGYDLSLFKGAPPGSLGSYPLERACEILLEPSVRARRIVPIEKTPYERILKKEHLDTEEEVDLETMRPTYEHKSTLYYWLMGRYVSEIKTLTGVPYIHPTSELLERMQVLTTQQ